jgi:hypothetical protein
MIKHTISTNMKIVPAITVCLPIFFDAKRPTVISWNKISIKTVKGTTHFFIEPCP